MSSNDNRGNVSSRMPSFKQPDCRVNQRQNTFPAARWEAEEKCVLNTYNRHLRVIHSLLETCCWNYSTDLASFWWCLLHIKAFDAPKSTKRKENHNNVLSINLTLHFWARYTLAPFKRPHDLFCHWKRQALLQLNLPECFNYQVLHTNIWLSQKKAWQ